MSRGCVEATCNNMQKDFRRFSSASLALPHVLAPPLAPPPSFGTSLLLRRCHFIFFWTTIWRFCCLFCSIAAAAVVAATVVVVLLASYPLPIVALHRVLSGIYCFGVSCCIRMAVATFYRHPFPLPLPLSLLSLPHSSNRAYSAFLTVYLTKARNYPAANAD